MQLIPVIDLLRGEVVHARGGNRDAYRPLASPLGGGSDPPAVVRALLALHPFRALYVADLDAIERRGDNRAIVRALRREFPRLELWVDAGCADADDVLAARIDDYVRPVLGSETLASIDALREAARAAPGLVLSLDFKGDALLGPAALLADPGLWPERVIAMTLARVGSDAGPDLERLQRLRALAPRCRLYAAGGVRGPADLDALASLGAAGVLLATALHAGRLPQETLARFD
ncbi:MAG TPA: HisA/HisF-related TIM barrel protein [Sandaracinaceae bacterium]